MKADFKTMTWRSKVIASASALALAATIVTIAPASAEEAYAAADATGYVTAAAYRAAESSPEILGITGVSTNDA